MSPGERPMIEFKGTYFERDVIFGAVRWYVAHPISYPQLEEMMEERGVEVDHATLNRWVLKYVPLLEQRETIRPLATSDVRSRQSAVDIAVPPPPKPSAAMVRSACPVAAQAHCRLSSGATWQGRAIHRPTTPRPNMDDRAGSARSPPRSMTPRCRRSSIHGCRSLGIAERETSRTSVSACGSTNK
jgi:hypothetical protein